MIMGRCGPRLLVPPNRRGRRVTIHHRHLAVHQCDLVWNPPERRDRFQAITDYISRKAEFSELNQRDFLVDRIIFRHQYPDFRAQLFQRLTRPGDGLPI